MVPLIQRELVQKKRLMNDEDFINILSIAQSFPGAIAINTAGLVGNRLAGFPGLLVAILGSVLPSFTVMIMAATILFHFGDLVLVQNFSRSGPSYCRIDCDWNFFYCQKSAQATFRSYLVRRPFCFGLGL